MLIRTSQHHLLNLLGRVESMTDEKPSGSSTTPAPKDIKQIDPGNLGITWTDGHESVYSVLGTYVRAVLVLIVLTSGQVKKDSTPIQYLIIFALLNCIL